MANLAQVMNVLQSVLLSDGESLVKTPTWYVFKMFLRHHEANLIRSSLAAPELDKFDKTVPMLSYSVSEKDSKVFLTVTNCSLDEDCELLIDSETFGISSASSEIICTDIHAFNDFDGSEPVTIKENSSYEIINGKLKAVIPAHSVVSFEIA